MLVRCGYWYIVDCRALVTYFLFFLSVTEGMLNLLSRFIGWLENMVFFLASWLWIYIFGMYIFLPFIV